MILVSVGTLPFDRLVIAADEMAAHLGEPVVIQRSAGAYVPRCARHVDYVDEAQMARWLFEARVVIAHAGAGSILSALRAGTPLVLAPRLACLAEVGDDHQFELAGALASQRRAVVVTELSVEALAQAIAQAEQLGAASVGETGLHAALRDWLDKQAARPPSRWARLLRWVRRVDG
jgi:UDP-N-acetylglucosamine transferase subunit ALG13